MKTFKFLFIKFVKSYFYFSAKESRGVIFILFLIVLAIMFPSIVSWVTPNDNLKITIQEMDTLDSKINQGKFKNNQFFKTKFTKFDTNKTKLDSNKYQKQFIDKNKKIASYPLDINTADSISLVKLYRIGPALASRIIRKRNSLGGFLNLHQLTEVFGFDEDFLFDLKDKIYVDATKVKKINLNTVGEDQLKTHPYFKFKISRVIVNYRNQHGAFKNFDELKNIKIINDSIINRIRPYCVID